MKKLLFILMACMTLTACSSNDESTIFDDSEIVKTQVEDIEIVVKGAYVLSPEWIDKVRQKVSVSVHPETDFVFVVGYTAEYKGHTVIYFEDWLSSSYSNSTYIYSLSGQKSDSLVARTDLANHNIFCPDFEGWKENLGDYAIKEPDTTWLKNLH